MGRYSLNSLPIILVGLLGALIFCIVLLSSVPPVSRDALVHHLAVPKLYIKHGGMYEIPSMDFSYYPMNIDLLYLIPLYLENDIAPKFIHFGFALLTAFMLYRYLKARVGVAYALFGSLFFLSIPIIVKLSITAYVDLGLIFFTTASLLFLFRWMETGFRLRYLFLSALFCGLAMGTKYNGLITLALLALFIPFLYSRSLKGSRPGLVKPLGYGVFFLIVSTLVFSPWMIRNYHWKHNPVYPLFDTWFNPPRESSSKAQAKASRDAVDMDPFIVRNVIFNETGWDMAFLPIRIFFQGKDDSQQYFDGKLNPFLLVLPIFAFFRIPGDPSHISREKKTLLAFAILYYSIAFFSTIVRIRYISPIIPALVILSAFGAKNLGFLLGRFLLGGWKVGNGILCLFLAIPLVINALYVMDQFKLIRPISYLNGSVTRSEYITHFRPEYPAIQFINTHVPEGGLIAHFFVGKRGYYCDRPYLIEQHDRLREFLGSSRFPEEIHKRFRQVGVSHFLVNDELFNDWTGQSLNEKEQELLTGFLSEYVVRLYGINGYSVFALK